MFPPEITSKQVSENMRPIWHGPCLNPNVQAKYSRRCQMKCALLWLSPGLSVVDRPSPAFRQQSSVVASTGRPARVSSSSDVRPRLNLAAHLVTD